jgi:hypothetical protein
VILRSGSMTARIQPTSLAPMCNANLMPLIGHQPSTARIGEAITSQLTQAAPLSRPLATQPLTPESVQCYLVETVDGL